MLIHTIHTVNFIINLSFPDRNFSFKDSNVLCKVLEGHTDAVWQLVLSGQKLLSCSSDGSVRLWDPNLTHPLQSTFNRIEFYVLFKKRKHSFLFR
jgi:WD40 repeat protein